MFTHSHLFYWPAFLLSASAFSLAAPATTQLDINDLLTLSLTELMDVEVTSVGKKSKKIAESAAAVFVISQDDIHRAGVRSVAEALRLAPGLQVDRYSAHSWRISSRGSFNGVYDNKLLVLVDGRSVYNLQLSSTFWDSMDMLLENIERIEVIRGPGGTLWGANAVNGIVNIITKRAQDTQGNLLNAGSGSEDRAFGGLRHGGQLGRETYYRVYGKSAYHAGLEPTRGNDAWHSSQGGFRLDGGQNTDTRWTVHGDMYQFRENDVSWQTLVPAQATVRGGNLVGLWERSYGEDATLTLQTYYDDQTRHTPNFGVTNRVLDFELQHHWRFRPGHELLWGLGWRWLYSSVPEYSPFNRDPALRRDQLFSAFIQDDLCLVPQTLRLTLGSKFEHDDYTGFNFQPNLRLLWLPRERLTAWAAVSRAVRTPSQMSYEVKAELAIPTVENPFYPIPMHVRLLGNKKIEPETVTAWELGARGEWVGGWSWDITGFYNVYDKLIVRTEMPLVDFNQPWLVLLSNNLNEMEGETYGAEMALDWRRDKWRASLAYTWLKMQMRLYPGTRSASDDIESETAPHRVSLRVGTDLNPRWSLDAWLRYARHMGSSAIGIVPAHTEFDLRLAWHPAKDVEIALTGQNLFDPAHQEYNPDTFNKLVNAIPRGAYLQVRWAF